MGLLMTANVKFPWCGINKMYDYLRLSMLLLCTWKCMHPAFPREQAVKDLDGDLADSVPALCLFLYGGVCSCFFHNQRSTSLISIQNMEDDGQMCHFMSWIVPFQNQFKGLSLPYCAKYLFIVQQYPVSRDYCAFLPRVDFSHVVNTDLIQATQTIESAQLMKQKTPT